MSKAAAGSSRKLSDESSSSGATATTEKRCVACAGEGSPKIIRDENFEKVMRFYWEGLSVDVKPKELKTQELCGPCWDALVEFYDTNDVLVLMESHLRKLQKSLITQSVKGIETLKKDGQPLLNVHKLVSEKWGDGMKSDDDDEPKEVSVTTYLEEPKGGNKGKASGSASGKPGSSKSTPKPKTAPPSTRGGRNTRKRPANSRKRKDDFLDDTSEESSDTPSTSTSEDSG